MTPWARMRALASGVVAVCMRVSSDTALFEPVLLRFPAPRVSPALGPLLFESLP